MWLSTDVREAQCTPDTLGGFDCRCSNADRKRQKENQQTPGGKALLVIGVT